MSTFVDIVVGIFGVVSAVVAVGSAVVATLAGRRIEKTPHAHV